MKAIVVCFFLLFFSFNKNVISRPSDNNNSSDFLYGLWSSSDTSILEKISFNKVGYLVLFRNGVSLSRDYTIVSTKNNLILGAVNDGLGTFSFEIKPISNQIIDLTIHRELDSLQLRLTKVVDYKSGIFFID